MRVKLDPGAIMPTRAHKTDAGLDLYAPGTCYVYPDDSIRIDTGVHVEIPEGYAGLIKSRSGYMVNHCVVTDGVVDCGYTGAINVKLFNHGYSELRIDKGSKIAQLVLVKIDTPELELVDELETSERGDAGFGSTGKLKNKRIVESEFYEYYNKGYADAEIARNIGVPRENVYEYRKRRGLVQHKKKGSDI